MDVLLTIWWGLLAASLVYVALRGGAPERFAIAALTATSLATYVVTLDRSVDYRSIEHGLALADVCLAVCLIPIALLANRRWPLPSCGIQLVCVVGHATKLLVPQLSPFTYAFMTGFWSWPILLLIVIGTFRHRRRIAAHGVDRSWRTFSVR